MELYAGSGVAGLRAVGFGAVRSLLLTFPTISAGAGCVIVRRQSVSVLFLSGCGGH